MAGPIWIEQIAQATGLPMTLIKPELELLILQKGYNPQNVTLEQIRELMAELVQDVLAQLKTELVEEKRAEPIQLR